MKNRIRALLLIGALLLTSSTMLAQMQRVKKNINREWKFKLGDHPNAEKIDYNDKSWDNIGLPHSFSIPYFLSQDFYIGYGWYRRVIDIPQYYLEKRVSIEFEAAFQDAEIFINGKKAGGHKGGYTGFSIDITDYITEGENILAVRLNNLWNAQIAPRAGEHVFSGGIYRDVYLVATDAVHIDWYGTFVTTPKVSKESATVNIKTEVRNSEKKNQKVRLDSKIYSPEGKLITSISTTKSIKSGQVFTFDQTSNVIDNLDIWGINSPKLYEVISEVHKGEVVVDSYETKFGFRTFEWTADKGFFLNGEHLYLRGANVHQDHAGWGDAVTNAGMYRDLNMLKDAGFNFIRGSHYPHDPAFSQACDELGLLFWAEGVIWGTGGFGESDGTWESSAYPIYEKDRAGFHTSAKQQLSELIRIHHNHPSIVAWSMSNEPFFTASHTLENMKGLLKETVDLSHKLDPTRPAAIGGSQRPIGEARIDKIGDIAGYNGDGGIIPDFQNPGIPNMVSEYGSTTVIRPGEYEAGWGELVKNNTQHGVEWRSGHAIWCAFDHGSIAGSMLGKMGIVDYFRIPKRAWYWYRNEYENIAPPRWAKEGVASKIKLTADKTSNIQTDGTDDTMLKVAIFDEYGTPISNSPTITLSIISGSGEFPTGSMITFDEKSDITIIDGQAAIEFRSYYAGETIIRATGTGLESAEIKLNFVGDVPHVEGKTPRAKERPYIRYTKENQVNIISKFGQNNPTFSSSSIINHTEGLATDGDTNTCWKPASDDKAPYWILDTERNLYISEIKLQFNEQPPFQYLVEISEDKISWKVIESCTEDVDSTGKSITIKVPENTTGRFIRVKFNDRLNFPPHIAECEVLGRVIN